MKIAIAQSGPENAGKTTTIRIMYEMLLQQHLSRRIRLK
jgi:ABC-type multidrug transport system ATPase subunit